MMTTSVLIASLISYPSSASEIFWGRRLSSASDRAAPDPAKSGNDRRSGAGMGGSARAAGSGLAPQAWPLRLGPSGLSARRGDHQSVKLVRHFDLAGQARIRLHLEGEVEHVGLHRRRRADLFPPRLVDIEMACRARAGAAALGLDFGHAVFDRRLHDGGADFAVHGAGRALGINEGDFRHDATSEVWGLILRLEQSSRAGLFYPLAPNGASTGGRAVKE